MKDRSSPRFFPLIVCAEFNSPIDALLSLCVPQDEAMDLVAASWREGQPSVVVTTIDGGRHVAVLPTADGHWAACNAFPEQQCSTPGEAERRLKKLLKRGRRGMVALLPGVWPEAPENDQAR